MVRARSRRPPGPQVRGVPGNVSEEGPHDDSHAKKADDEADRQKMQRYAVVLLAAVIAVATVAARRRYSFWINEPQAAGLKRVKEAEGPAT
jgi:hypothetical protein